MYRCPFNSLVHLGTLSASLLFSCSWRLRMCVCVCVCVCVQGETNTGKTWGEEITLDCGGHRHLEVSLERWSRRWSSWNDGQTHICVWHSLDVPIAVLSWTLVVWWAQRICPEHTKQNAIEWIPPVFPASLFLRFHCNWDSWSEHLKTCALCYKYCTNQRSICVQNERVHSMSSFFTYWTLMSEIVDLYNKWNIWKHEISARDKLLAR